MPLAQDVLAKHCGPLLDHFDLLLPYAELGPAFYHQKQRGNVRMDVCQAALVPPLTWSDALMSRRSSRWRREYAPVTWAAMSAEFPFLSMHTSGANPGNSSMIPHDTACGR